LDSKVEIINNEVFVDKTQIYYTVEYPEPIDGPSDTVSFYRYIDGESSLNQSDESYERARKLRLSLSSTTACRIWEAFEEIGRNNEKILQSMQE